MVEAGVHAVPVPGGALAVEVLAGTTEPVLAVHGISSHRKLWSWLRQESPQLTLVAPDLRGRGDSLGVQGECSVARHADDMVAVLDALDLDRAHVIGMSMGGFVAIDLAHRYPHRVKSLVLVDGGFPMAKHPDLRPELVPTVFADRLARLTKHWQHDEFVQFFTESTAPLLDPEDPLLQDYLRHDLDTEGRVRLSGEALLSDATSVFFGENPWRELTLPIRFAHAQWASGADSAPAYPDVTEYAEKCVDVRYLPGLDHAGSIMSKAGAVVVADLLEGALA